MLFYYIFVTLSINNCNKAKPPPVFFPVFFRVQIKTPFPGTGGSAAGKGENMHFRKGALSYLPLPKALSSRYSMAGMNRRFSTMLESTVSMSTKPASSTAGMKASTKPTSSAAALIM